MEAFLDQLHARARAKPVFHRLAIVSRILLALAFVPTGLVKLLGERFTSISSDNPIGLFFEAMYQSGGYWHFLGASQVIAGILLLIPLTATLGAVLFFPIALNIFVITMSLHFTGTPFLTAGILLASVFLLCWDYNRLKPVLFARESDAWFRNVRIGRLERAGYALGALAGLGVFSWTRGLAPTPVMLACLGFGLFAACMVLAAWIRAARVGRSIRTA